MLDRNGDGRVTIQDLEDLCCKYLMSKIWNIHDIIPSNLAISWHLMTLINKKNKIKVVLFVIIIYQCRLSDLLFIQSSSLRKVCPILDSAIVKEANWKLVSLNWIYSRNIYCLWWILSSSLQVYESYWKYFYHHCSCSQNPLWQIITFIQKIYSSLYTLGLLSWFSKNSVI